MAGVSSHLEFWDILKLFFKGKGQASGENGLYSRFSSLFTFKTKQRDADVIM